MKVDNHDHARLNGNAKQCDIAHPDCHAEVVAQEPPQLGESWDPVLASVQFWILALSVAAAAADQHKHPFAYAAQR